MEKKNIDLQYAVTQKCNGPSWLCSLSLLLIHVPFSSSSSFLVIIVIFLICPLQLCSFVFDLYERTLMNICSPLFGDKHFRLYKLITPDAMIAYLFHSETVSFFFELFRNIRLYGFFLFKFLLWSYLGLPPSENENTGQQNLTTPPPGKRGYRTGTGGTKNSFSKLLDCSLLFFTHICWR